MSLGLGAFNFTLFLDNLGLRALNFGLLKYHAPKLVRTVEHYFCF